MRFFDATASNKRLRIESVFMQYEIESSSHNLISGQLKPFGATLCSDGCNFSIYCPDAEEVYLCLFDEQEKPTQQILLRERVQSKWFGFVRGVKAGQLYGYRVRSKSHKKVSGDMSVGKLLVDPYAKALNKPLTWNKNAYLQTDNHAFIPKCVVLQTPHETNLPKPKLAHQRIIYEAHIKGLTKLHPDVPEEHRGTYLGCIHPSVISHLKSLGITSIQFMPLNSFMPEPFISDKGLTNYWGYNPINFFCAEPRYAYRDAFNECRQMIRTLKDEGFEVILDVVFNHTAESGEGGPILSFKGLCHKHAYLTIENDEHHEPIYLNYSGCGNTIKVSNTYMMTLIMDAMRYWVQVMGVDGFRFDLASVLAREPMDFKCDATFFKLLRQDPVLSQAVMIAEPWDIGPGGYQLGQYPDYWLEVNDKFRDSVRGFWRGDNGLKADFATRLMGSRDVFHKGVRPMHSSVNNVTYHDGFTLHDIVSYERKHNLANKEDNRDGHNHNLTANYGVEGETDDVEIIKIRERQKRNLFTTLIFSQGTPHILGGDELSRSQNGNNNAYCQDNEINWYNWRLSARQDNFLRFCQYAIKLRHQNSLLANMMFEDDMYTNAVNIELTDWYRVDGSYKREKDWVNDNHNCFALHVKGHDENNQTQEYLYCVNSSTEAREYNLPLLLNNKVWTCILNTALERIEDYAAFPVSPLFTVAPRSIYMFKKVLTEV